MIVLFFWSLHVMVMVGLISSLLWNISFISFFEWTICGILPHDTNWKQTRCQQSANNNTVFLVVIIDIAVVTIIHTMDYNAVSWCNRQSDTLTLFFIVFNELGNCIILGQSQVPHKNLFWWPTRRQWTKVCWLVVAVSTRCLVNCILEYLQHPTSDTVDEAVVV